MSTSRTYTPYVGGGAGGAVQAGDPWTHAEGEEYRQNIDLLAYNCGPYPLGGDDNGILSASYVPVNAWMSHDLNVDTLGGMTIDLVAFYRTADAATSVTVRLRNTTDSSTACTGTTSTSTTDVREVISATLASGIKTYRLEVIGGNATNPVYARGYIRIRKVAA